MKSHKKKEKRGPKFPPRPKTQLKSVELTGKIKRHPDGFGFFIPEEAGYPDAYIPAHAMKGVMTNDRVVVEMEPEHHDSLRYRGEIVRIVERAQNRVIGRYTVKSQQFAVLIDHSHAWGGDLHIKTADAAQAKDGDLVVAEVLTYPSETESFTGRVTSVLGNADDPLTDVMKVVYGQSIPLEFPNEVLTEAKAFHPEVSTADQKGRRDLKHLSFITIDGTTAKDFDDAVYVENESTGFHLWVAIADVSHYVRVDSAIDKEAYNRGNSTYFPNFVIPMLPEILSNELCSLRPKIPRLAFVAEMKLDFQGVITHSEFYEAVIVSHARVTYGQAQEVVDGNPSAELSHVQDMILRAADLAKVLMAKRTREGSLQIEIPETEIEIDDTGMPVDIFKSERLFSHKLIEELMLICNQAVAKFLNDKNIPALHRIHEAPKQEDVETLENFFRTFGSVGNLGGGILQKKIVKALQDFAGTPQALVLNIMVLRSMTQAKYSAKPVGHFGLNFQDYAHFTSPIRRYADLIVHRVLKTVINQENLLYDESELEGIGTFISACEQRSVKAERQFEGIKKARFMESHLGKEFDGIISSVVKFGVFVLLREFDVDGLIHIEDLGDDRFIYDEDRLILFGKRSGKQFKVGDEVRVQVAAVNVEDGKIDFAFAASEKNKTTAPSEKYKTVMSFDESNKGAQRPTSGKKSLLDYFKKPQANRNEEGQTSERSNRPSNKSFKGNKDSQKKSYGKKSGPPKKNRGSKHKKRR